VLGEVIVSRLSKIKVYECLVVAVRFWRNGTALFISTRRGGADFALLRLCPAKSRGFKQQCGVETWRPGGLANYKSEEIYVSGQEDGKSGDSAIEREIGPSPGFSPSGRSE
jgi:hypothetical protein